MTQENQHPDAGPRGAAGDLKPQELAGLPDAIKLMAMADGELPAAEQAELVARMRTGDPGAAAMTQTLLQHQALKQACQRATQAPIGGCPDDLAAKLRAITAPETDTLRATETTSLANSGDEPAAVIGKIGPSFAARWLPSAVAALLLLSALVVFNLDRGGSETGPLVSNLDAQILSVSTVDRLARRHLACAGDPTRMYPTGVSPESTADLPVAVAALLDDQDSAGTDPVSLGLDLAAAGYEFVAIGPCAAPGGDSAHLLYRRMGSTTGSTSDETSTNPADMLSVWIQPASTSPAADQLEDNRVYTIDQTGCSPVRVWKQGGMVIYVAAESEDGCRKAAQAVRGQAI